jgi:hypothetical protein
MADKQTAARREIRSLLAFAALIALSLLSDVIAVTSLSTARQVEGWRVLGIGWLVGAVAMVILALTVRNPDGTIFTRNPQIAQQNRRRIKRWTGGGGFALLLGLGLALGATRGMFLVALLGVFTGFAMVFFAMTLYAYFAIVRPRLRGAKDP